jgi:hypothetical protein
VRASNLAKRRSRSSLVSNPTPLLRVLAGVVALTADRLVRFRLLVELPSLPLTRFDSLFITLRIL